METTLHCLWQPFKFDTGQWKLDTPELFTDEGINLVRAFLNGREAMAAPFLTMLRTTFFADLAVSETTECSEGDERDAILLEVMANVRLKIPLDSKGYLSSTA